MERAHPARMKIGPRAPCAHGFQMPNNQENRQPESPQDRLRRLAEERLTAYLRNSEGEDHVAFIKYALSFHQGIHSYLITVELDSQTEAVEYLVREVFWDSGTDWQHFWTIAAAYQNDPQSVAPNPFELIVPTTYVTSLRFPEEELSSLLQELRNCASNGYVSRAVRGIYDGDVMTVSLFGGGLPQKTGHTFTLAAGGDRNDDSPLETTAKRLWEVLSNRFNGQRCPTPLEEDS